MKDFMKALDELPWYIKLVLCIPMLDIVWAIYRIAKSYYAENTTGIVVGVLCIFPGAALVWLFDAIYVAVNKKIWWFC